MFNTLLESRAVHARRTGGSLLSLMFHATLITGAVIVTANATVTSTADEPVTEIHFVPRTPPPIAPPVKTDHVFTAAPIAKGFQKLVAPIDIPDVLPTIDLSKLPTNIDDFTGRGRPGGTSTGIDVPPNALVPTNGIYSALQVEKAVVPVPGTVGPTYPDMLRTAGIDGTVRAQFVVDTLGRADVATFVALHSDHTLFSAAVRTSLGRMRFLPAEYGGRKVPQLVQQSFQFTVRR